MNVHFIDTSVFTNIVDVDGRNQQRKKVIKELSELMSEREKNVLILPYATIIETGNHIAHISDGRLRRKAAETFRNFLLKTIRNEAPWRYYGNQITEEDIEIIVNQFPDAATNEEGFGDLSIIRAYERYKEETPAINKIRIWSLDVHLSTYSENIISKGLRNKRR